MQIFEEILELIYPNICGFCGEINKNSICENCLKKIQKYDISNIKKTNSKFYSKQAYIFTYKNDIREIILKYKFDEKAYLYKTFAKIILNNKKICRYIESYDIIVPVPIHKKRLIERGYNQSKLISKEISRRIKSICFNDNILKKTKNNVPQSTLKKNERSLNVQNVYTVENIDIISNKKILLFDDIFTTGNTVNECAKILIKKGAKEVGVLTIAK
jgi:ComF family protein